MDIKSRLEASNTTEAIGSDTESKTGSRPRQVSVSSGRSLEKLSRIAFFSSVALVTTLGIFWLGMYFQKHKLWPYEPIETVFTVLDDAIEYGGFAPENAVGDAPEGASRDTWTVHNKGQLAHGYRAVMGYDAEDADFGIWLFDTDGNKVHQRTLNYHVQDPDGPSGGSEAPHAFHFLADGSVIVNTDKGDVMARYDVCGEPMWSKKGAFHHSLAPDPNGGLWTWRGEQSAFAQYQYLVLFNPDNGEVIREISLVDDIINASARNKAIFTLVPGYELKHEQGLHSVHDLFHPNDLEILQESMAAAFPQFEVGDMLMSFRNINLLAVLDPNTFEIKWWRHGPWIQQHDPDFTASGEITLFNNNGWRSASSIVAIDPSTQHIRTVDIDPNFRFYSQYMGKHNYLENETLQVVVPFEGRALEFDKNGELILEINNIFSEHHNAFLADYTLLLEDFFATPPAQFSCNSGETHS
ncbi:MAG: arylsulfotransferase family protein [Granulosicoccus sp.]